MSAKNYKYSKVIMLKRSNGGFTINTIAPNPFRDKVSIDFGAETAEMTYISLVNMAGSTIKTIALNAKKGMNHVELTGLDNLNTGIYLIVLRNSNGQVSEKLLKGY